MPEGDDLDAVWDLDETFMLGEDAISAEWESDDCSCDEDMDEDVPHNTFDFYF